MYQKSILQNGLRVLTHSMEGTKSVTCLVLVKAGSRWENAKNNGVAHFLEHMFFKGAKKYTNAKAVAEAIDGVGGEFNAFTGKEYAGYYVKLSASQKELAVDVLADMLLHARFDQEEIEKERGVILEEFNMYQDMPMYQVGWNFERALFGDQPLGWDEIGLKDIIKSLNREDFVAYKEALYTPENMVFVMTGAVEHEEACALAEKFFDMPAKKGQAPFEPFNVQLQGQNPVHLQEKASEQSHLVLGFPSYPVKHPDHYVVKVLATILGGNMSSRMFSNVREEKGLAYYISTSAEFYLDAGTLYTRAGVDIARGPLALSAIMQEYRDISEKLVSELELAKAKAYLLGKMDLSLEDHEAVAQLMASSELLLNKIRTPEAIRESIEKVTREDVQRVAQAILQPNRVQLAVIGPNLKEDFLKASLQV